MTNEEQRALVEEATAEAQNMFTDIVKEELEDGYEDRLHTLELQGNWSYCGCTHGYVGQVTLRDWSAPERWERYELYVNGEDDFREYFGWEDANPNATDEERKDAQRACYHITTTIIKLVYESARAYKMGDEDGEEVIYENRM